MSPTARLALMDVGHGNCAVLFSGKEAIVFDCPPGKTLHRFLRRRGVAAIRHLIISHADKDHAGGVAALIQSGIAVQKVWILDDQTNRTIHYENVWRAFEEARSRGASVQRGYPHSDENPAEWGDFRVEWLAPPHERRARSGSANSLSVVCRLLCCDRGVILFPGDVDCQGIASIPPNRTLKADWLVAPHHGGSLNPGQPDETCLVDFVSRVDPTFVFFSFSRRKYELPRPEIVRILTDHFPDVSARCSQLSTHCATDLPTHRIARGFVSEGITEQDNHCCAGTILLEVGEEGVTWGDQSLHTEFVLQLDSPLCRCRFG